MSKDHHKTHHSSKYIAKLKRADQALKHEAAAAAASSGHVKSSTETSSSLRIEAAALTTVCRRPCPTPKP